MKDHAVIIAGAGPTGLMLAAELSLLGVDVALIERRHSQALAGSRAGGFHARTLEILDQRGVADRFIAEGQPNGVVLFAMTRLKLSDFPTRHPYILALFQNHIERILAAWVEELGVPIYRGTEMTGFTQDETGVEIRIANSGRSVVRGQYLVGCDGGRSLVRKTAGIEFPGADATTSWMIAEVRMSQEPSLGMRENQFGTFGIAKLDESGVMRVIITERNVNTSGELTLEELSEKLIHLYGSDFGVHGPIWLSRFTDATRQASSYRDGRVLLAGDAAHVHPPMGGQGLNIGMQDAVNLGWKLAQVVNGTSPESLLDTYQDERYPVAAAVLRDTMAQSAIRRGDEHSRAALQLVNELAEMDEPRKRIVGRVSGLSIHYDFGDGHQLMGRRIPDLDIATVNGVTRIFTQLHRARPVLLNFRQAGAIDIEEWSDRVRLIDATYNSEWNLPTIGVVDAPGAVLVRPDGYVAWVGDATQHGLHDALTKWFGAPRVSESTNQV